MKALFIPVGATLGAQTGMAYSQGYKAYSPGVPAATAYLADAAEGTLKNTVKPKAAMAGAHLGLGQKEKAGEELGELTVNIGTVLFFELLAGGFSPAEASEVLGGEVTPAMKGPAVIDAAPPAVRPIVSRLAAPPAVKPIVVDAAPPAVKPIVVDAAPGAMPRLLPWERRKRQCLRDVLQGRNYRR